MAPGLDSWGGSGKGQFRDIIQQGVSWTETYPPLKTTDSVTRGWLVLVNQYWRNRTVFDIVHPALALMGAGGGTPLVNGASQTGASINTDGWPNNTTVLKAGDIIKFANINPVYFATANVTSNGSGQAAIPISPPIFSGGSPAENAALTISSVTFRAVIFDADFPGSELGDYYYDLSLTFREAP
jgi:hypothetical protein